LSDEATAGSPDPSANTTLPAKTQLAKTHAKTTSANFQRLIFT
jgi:hypothetical protein